MNEMIKIDFGNENPAVSSLELHKALETKTAYKDWFPRICEYGFTEGKDFATLQSNFKNHEKFYKRKLCLKYFLIFEQICLKIAQNSFSKFREKVYKSGFMTTNKNIHCAG